MRHLQESSAPLYERTRLFRIYEHTALPGLFHTAEYSMQIMNYWVRFLGLPDDAEAATTARLVVFMYARRTGMTYVMTGCLQALARRLPAPVGGLDCGDPGNGCRVERDVEARAEADLDHIPRQAATDPAAQRLDHLGAAREAEDPRQDLSFIQSHDCPIELRRCSSGCPAGQLALLSYRPDRPGGRRVRAERASTVW